MTHFYYIKLSDFVNFTIKYRLEKTLSDRVPWRGVGAQSARSWVRARLFAAALGSRPLGRAAGMIKIQRSKFTGQGPTKRSNVPGSERQARTLLHGGWCDDK